MTPGYIGTFVAPAAYALLPRALGTPDATALLLAIGLQESGFEDRRQRLDGPACGYWQFEMGGMRDVLTARSTAALARVALRGLSYDPLMPAAAVHLAIDDNDILAFVFARLLLWPLPDPLPGRGDPAAGWAQYVAAWRPGRPRRATWDAFYAAAWDAASPVHDLEGRPST